MHIKIIGCLAPAVTICLSNEAVSHLWNLWKKLLIGNVLGAHSIHGLTYPLSFEGSKFPDPVGRRGRQEM